MEEDRRACCLKLTVAKAGHEQINHWHEGYCHPSTSPDFYSVWRSSSMPLNRTFVTASLLSGCMRPEASCHLRRGIWIHSQISDFKHGRERRNTSYSHFLQFLLIHWLALLAEAHNQQSSCLKILSAWIPFFCRGQQQWKGKKTLFPLYVPKFQTMGWKNHESGTGLVSPSRPLIQRQFYFEKQNQLHFHFYSQESFTSVTRGRYWRYREQEVVQKARTSCSSVLCWWLGNSGN